MTFRFLVLACCLISAPVHAADVTITDVNPSLLFDDTDPADENLEWVIKGWNEQFVVQDYSISAPGPNVLAIDPFKSSSAMGYSASAFGFSSAAVGPDATANGNDSLALGTDALSQTTESMAMGYFSTATGIRSMAIGTNAFASGENAIAVGRSASSSWTSSVAIGNFATTLGDLGIAIGSGSKANQGAIAVGNIADASQFGIAIGEQASSQNQSVALGRGAQSFKLHGAALGDFSNADGENATAIGAYAKATGARSVALGYRASAFQTDSIVLGSIPGQNFATEYTDVGIGTNQPMAPLHLLRKDATQEFLMLESNQPMVNQDRAMMYLANNGGIRFEFANNSQGTAWRFQAATGNEDRFEVTKVGTGDIELAVDAAGNMEIQGTLTELSDRGSKERIEPMDGVMILKRLAEIPVAEWSYRDTPAARHAGPMAQDFHAAFGLGKDERHLAARDMAGINMAAIQALIDQNQRMAAQIDELKSALETLQTN